MIADLGNKLPTATHSSDPTSKNLMRPSFVSADSDARIYPDAVPLRWQEDLGNSEADQRTQPTLDTFADQQSNKRGNRRGNRSRDARPELVKEALDCMAAGRAGENDSHMLGVMGNMQAYGFSFADFDGWAAAAGCTCDRKPRWEAPPQGHQSDRPGQAIVNLARKHYGMPKNEQNDDQDHNEQNDDQADEQADNQGKPIFSSDAKGLIQAAEHIGIQFRFNLASNGMEVRPENDTMRRQLHSTGSTWRKTGGKWTTR